MKKLVVSLFIMVAASFFFVCGASAASQVQFSLQPGETMVVYLDNQYSFEVPGDSKGDYGFFNWTVSETPISHSGLIKSSVVNYAGASMPNITVSAQRDSTYSGNFTFMFDSSVGSGSTVRLYLSIAVTLQNQTNNPISGYMGLNLSGWNYTSSNIPNTGTLDEKLNQILDALGDSPLQPDFLGDDALFYIRSDYFNRTFGCSFDSDGWLDVSTWSDFGVYNWGSTNQPNYQLSPGTYLVYVMRPGGVEPNSIVFEGVDNSLYSFERLSVSSQLNAGYYFEVFLLDIKEIFSYTTLHFHYSGSATASLPVYIGFVVAPNDFIAGEAVNPDQSGLVSDVDNAGQQQQAQEDQLWTNINSYKGDLTFNIDDWSEAAGGLSYVADIFMTIWNNSPTQVIILSLMLGIAMLSIGRGAMAAVRVSRNRRDDD